MIGLYDCESLKILRFCIIFGFVLDFPPMDVMNGIGTLVTEEYYKSLRFLWYKAIGILRSL